jgi:hypothetical protein
MTTAQVETGSRAAYQKKLMDLLGKQNPIEVLSKTAGVLAGIVRENPKKKLQTRPFEGKWTPCEILGHLCDSEWVYGFRVRLILCQDNPTILGMDQDLWVAGQRYNEREPAELVEQFRHLRSYNLHTWRSMKPRDFERTGQHNERGPESLGLMLKMNAGHDLSHIDQITRYLKAIG